MTSFDWLWMRVGTRVVIHHQRRGRLAGEIAQVEKNARGRREIGVLTDLGDMVWPSRFELHLEEDSERCCRCSSGID